ncbi:coiled-coil domain-containing protein 14 isoform X7 [Pan troglodytes]|uniref:coiled-coil domain-containing protein 14 isoform X7 n=1 Tax=Pan troglodytes TaxID=9598 RepID=UPI003013A452
MKRGVRRDPFRKRKLGGRAKKVREPTAVNSFYREASLPLVWASLRRREMVRSGARPGQVLSSGRHTGPAKLTNGKKATYLRKIPRFNADSGYSIHSDSESQAETVHGLDGCASLLRDILRNEDSDNKKQIPNEASARSERDTSDLEQNWSLQDHYRMYSPIIYQALCEHVQTQMSLMNDLTSKNIPNGIPAVPCHAPSHSESQATPHSSYGLCTSTPVWSLQRPPCPPKVHSEVQTDGDSQFASQETHLDSQTHRSPTQSQPAFLATNEEKCAREQIREATSERKDLNIHVRDIKTVKDVQKAKNVNNTTEKVRIIKYLLGELKALVAEQEDSEIQRLITEMEACISVLPTVSGNTDIQVEIALAMQPLRSENAQLRRQLRILNQQLREQQKTQKPSGAVDCNLELFSLQSLNMSLQNQLEESLKSQELLQSKNEELLKVIENQKDENKKFSSIFKDKDQTILENKQQYDIEITRIKIELEEALVNVKSSQFKLETAEKENQILGITLRQRDAEVTRLRELTRTLQTSMAKLLSDLSVDSARCKPGNNLTKSLLNIHDKQLQHDPAPAHTSIMSYLNKLETNYSFTHSEPLSTIKNEETIEPDKPYENVLSSGGPQNSNTRGMEEVSAPGIISALSKQDSDEGSETMALIEDEHNLDNTIYIPFARSTPEKKSPLSKRLSPQPQIRAATTQLVSNSGLAVSGKENKLCTPVVSSSSTKKAEDAPEKLSRASDMKDTQLLKKIKEAIGKIPAATKEPEEQTACHGPSGCLSNSLQVKGNTVCDGSVFTSDLMSDWSISSFSTFTSRDEQDFRNGLAALDANIARLQKSLRTGLPEK